MDTPKAQLQMVLQKKFKVALTKGSIVYTTKDVAGGMQSTVVLAIADGKSFVGGKAEGKNTAEYNAAQKAIDFFCKEDPSLKPGAAGGTKRKAPAAAQPPAKKAKKGQAQQQPAKKAKVQQQPAKKPRSSRFSATRTC